MTLTFDAALCFWTLSNVNLFEQGSAYLQVSLCEAVALLAVLQCAEEAATVEDLLVEEDPCPGEQLVEE